MREANIANQAEIVSILAAKSQEMEELRTEVATSMAQERASMQAYIANHTTDQSVFSAMTASTEQLQRQNDELGQRLAAANAQIGVNASARRNSNRSGGGGGGGGSSSTASGTPWSNRNGGGGGGDGGGGGSSSTASGTPWSNRNGGGGSSSTAGGTPWSNRSTGGGSGGGTRGQSRVRQYIHYCYTHGCNANHDSKNCPHTPRNPNRPETARCSHHKENATFDNMMGGNPRMLDRRWHWLDENNKCTVEKPPINNN